MNQHVNQKKQAVRDAAFSAKVGYNETKHSFDDMSIDDYDENFPEITELRHDMKFLMALLSASKFEEIIHLVSNPTRLMGLNLVIGFVRGLGIALALLLIFMVTMVSLADTDLLSFLQ